LLRHRQKSFKMKGRNPLLTLRGMDQKPRYIELSKVR
jgi:hypothetical protein